jgi:hypothetical protein
LYSLLFIIYSFINAISSILNHKEELLFIEITHLLISSGLFLSISEKSYFESISLLFIFIICQLGSHNGILTSRPVVVSFIDVFIKTSKKFDFFNNSNHVYA